MLIGLEIETARERVLRIWREQAEKEKAEKERLADILMFKNLALMNLAQRDIFERKFKTRYNSLKTWQEKQKKWDEYETHRKQYNKKIDELNLPYMKLRDINVVVIMSPQRFKQISEISQKAIVEKKAYVVKHGKAAYQKKLEADPEYQKYMIKEKERIARDKRETKEYKERFKKTLKRQKKRAKLHKALKVVAVGVAAAPILIAFAPAIAPAIVTAAKTVGTGIAKVKTLLAKGAKVIGTSTVKKGMGLVTKAAKAVVLKEATGKLTKVQIPEEEVEAIEILKQEEIDPALDMGINISEIEQALRQQMFPSEIIQTAEEKGVPLHTAFQPLQIRKLKKEKEKIQLAQLAPIIAGGMSLGLSLL